VDGYGIALRVVSRGKLRVEDGIGRQRRSFALDRVGSGLERLVLIGHAGFVTLDAPAWLRSIGAALVQIGRDGEVLVHSVPFGYDGHPIRRAQALAVTNGLDLAIARELIAGKLEGQHRILVRLGADLQEPDKLRAALHAADSIDRVRVIEANAAALYFPAWRDVRIRVCDRDLARIPARWLRTDSRASVLTGAPRAATSPINAMRNCLFACVESEARIALLAQGMCPTMGVLHADQRNRDSLALDAMEPVRADVDAFLLDLLEDRQFTARDFGELPNGICRIAAPLTHELALTLPHWRECLRPIAARLAQTFRESQANGCASPRTLAAKSWNKRSSVPGPARSPLLARPRSRGRTQRAYGARRPPKPGRALQPRARYAAGRYSNAGVGTARRACRRRVGNMASAQSKPRARRSQHRPQPATIRAAALS
jgi:CRISPR-associated endonuclease Cas1